jgi:ribonuclease Z
MGTPTWLVTHTHLDHVAALPVYVARRRMMKMEPPTIYLPAEAVDDVRRLLLVMQRLDRGRMVCQLNGVKPGEEIELSRDHVVTAFATTHTIPSVGYLVWERRNKLKEEYHGLPGEKIRDLRLAGTEVTREVRTPLLAYTGDTSPAGLDNCPAAFEAKVLITELSFIRPNHRREKIHKFGHMHLDDFLERADRFKNELIICAHFSTRYHPQEVRKYLDAKLPESLRSRMKLWL